MKLRRPRGYPEEDTHPYVCGVCQHRNRYGFAACEKCGSPPPAPERADPRARELAELGTDWIHAAVALLIFECAAAFFLCAHFVVVRNEMAVGLSLGLFFAYGYCITPARKDSPLALFVAGMVSLVAAWVLWETVGLWLAAVAVMGSPLLFAGFYQAYRREGILDRYR